MRKINGQCHCGNIRFEFMWSRADSKIPVRACSCTFCRKHGGVYTSDPQGRLTVEIADQSRVARYRFGTETADFHICLSCGVVPVVTSQIDGHEYGIVNVNAFEGVDRSELEESVMDFDGETAGSRLDRRKRNWISDVSFG